MLLLALVATLVPAAPGRADEWVIGNREHPWEEWGGQVPLSLDEDGKEVGNPWLDWVGLGFQPAGQMVVARMDIATEPGWLQPVRIDSTANLSLGLLERAIRSKPVSDRSIFLDEEAGVRPYNSKIDAPNNIVDGDVESYIYNKGGAEFKLHTMFYFDLGWPFPVNRIRFYTRPGFELFAMPSYTLSVNDGDRATYRTATIDPTGFTYWDQAIRVWDSLAQEFINTQPDIDIRFPTRYVRYMSLGDTLISEEEKTRWELSEVEVYGDGYVPGYTYTSVVIPFEDAANWGALRWHAEVDPGATVSLRTRTGSTPDPYRYFLWTGIGPTGRLEVTRAEYRAAVDDYNLKTRAAPVVDDTDSWSFWSPPYTVSGRAITSPAPADYLQFELVVSSSNVNGRARVDSVVVEFSSPPVAQELVGELGYDAVRPGRWEEFRYAIRARVGAADTGFDAVRMITPDRVDSASIGDLAVDGAPVVPDSLHVESDGFTLYLPEHIGPVGAGCDVLVEMHFATRVFAHGTSLSALVFDTRNPEALAQSILPGDASSEIDTDSAQVLWELGGSLLETSRVSPNPFTPNGDGINDNVRIDYGLFQVDRPVPVSFSVYDLAGRVVYSRTRSEASGPRSVRWHGTNHAGGLVSPGLYVWQIRADTAVDEFVESGTVAVAY